MKSWMSIELKRRNDRVTGGGSGGDGMSKTERSAKWSDGVDGRQVMEGEMLSRVIRRSSVLPLE